MVSNAALAFDDTQPQKPDDFDLPWAKQMAPDSVYHKALSDLFDKADAVNVEETKQLVQFYLDAHDCMGLKHYLLQNTSASGTDRAIDEFNRAITVCTGGARTAPVISKKPS